MLNRADGLESLGVLKGKNLLNKSLEIAVDLKKSSAARLETAGLCSSSRQNTVAVQMFIAGKKA